MKNDTNTNDDYFNLIQKELLLKRDQLSSLIKQSTLLGNYYEEIIKETLVKFIPKKYSLATGILTHNKKNSKQIDIIIYDNTESYPIFTTQDMIIIEPLAVKIVFEVKSEITTRTLNDAKAKLRSAIDVYNLSQPKGAQHKLVTIIFGFSSDLSLSTLEKRCKEEGIDQIVVLSKRNGEIIFGQFNSLINNIAHILKYRVWGYYPKSLLIETGYLKNDNKSTK